MIQLSIIIPVYNSEKYLSQCIQSCLDQNITKSSYEIIIVNDGSIDNSQNIAEEFINRNSNITLISQHNRGLSAARNTGLKHAKGIYTWFIDSDDWIVKNCLLEIMEECYSNNLDFLWIGHKDIENGKYIQNHIYDSHVKGSLEFFTNDLRGYNYAWKYIVKTNIYTKNNLFFCEGLIFEDAEFTPRLMRLDMQYCKSYPKHILNYRILKSSLSRRVTVKHLEDAIKIVTQNLLYSNTKKTNSKALDQSSLTLISATYGHALKSLDYISNELQSKVETIRIKLHNNNVKANTKKEFLFVYYPKKFRFLYLFYKKYLKSII